MRRFELSDGKSNKFWEIDLDGTSFSVTFGKIGTSGQTQTKTFDNASKAQTEYDKLVKEKTKKGYTEVGAGDAPPKKAAPPKPVETPKAPAAIAPSEQKKIESQVTEGVDWAPLLDKPPRIRGEYRRDTDQKTAGPAPYGVIQVIRPRRPLPPCSRTLHTCHVLLSPSLRRSS